MLHDREEFCRLPTWTVLTNNRTTFLPHHFYLVSWTFQLSACERNRDQVKSCNNGSSLHWFWAGNPTIRWEPNRILIVSDEQKTKTVCVPSVFHKLYLFFLKYFTAMKAKTVHTKVWELSRRCMWILFDPTSATQHCIRVKCSPDPGFSS